MENTSDRPSPRINAISGVQRPTPGISIYKSKESRGSGLGLAIVKNLVAAHGGEVDAHSEVGKGTTIRVTLPAEPAI